MRFASLGSGSEGNALAVELPPAGCGNYLLVDCGFGLKDVLRRLARLGLAPERLRGILVTHEHADHVGGVFRLAAATGITVHLTWGTREAVQGCAGFERSDCRLVRDDEPIAIGDLSIRPFAVPHDAREPVQFVFDDGRTRLGVLTDVGRSTPHLVTALSGLDALVLECNHDRTLLETGDYPPSLKRRIGGDFGHLENHAAAGILAAVDRSRLRRVIAAHLSKQNNRPRLAQQALADVLACAPDEITVADQDAGSGWFEI